MRWWENGRSRDVCCVVFCFVLLCCVVLCFVVIAFGCGEMSEEGGMDLGCGKGRKEWRGMGVGVRVRVRVRESEITSRGGRRDEDLFFCCVYDGWLRQELLFISFHSTPFPAAVDSFIHSCRTQKVRFGSTKLQQSAGSVSKYCRTTVLPYSCTPVLVTRQPDLSTCTHATSKGLNIQMAKGCCWLLAIGC
jgi:hypothetical protein